MDNQLSKEDQARVEEATKDLQKVCEKHDVEVVAYIHTMGPRIAVIPNQSEEPQNETAGTDAPAGERVPAADKQPSRNQPKG